jgi:hypothetical protein
MWLKKNDNGLLLASCLLASLGTTQADGFERLDFPYRERIFTPTYSGRYSPQLDVKKTDIIISGDKVTIDQPLLTNGGDIVIYAASIVINAPIDTRIYLDHSAYMQRSGSCTTSLDMLANLGNAKSAFTDYYTKAWLWNGSRKWWELQSASAYPEIPQGDTPHYCAGSILAGTSAPSESDLNLGRLRSGSITIIATSINFCDECLAGC